MLIHPRTPDRRPTHAAVAALALCAAISAVATPAVAVARDAVAASVGQDRRGVGRAHAGRAHHRHRRMAGLRSHPPFAAAGLPAGYASDDSPFNVQADDDAFDTGAFYGCLHTVMTAGGYRPADTCD